MNVAEAVMAGIFCNGGGGGGGGNANIFTGTLAEWNALTPTEKASYTHVFTTDVINTLSGYGITDAYTKAEVDALLNTETATTLYDGTVPNAAYKATLVESILLYKRLYVLVYIDDSKDYTHVSEISVKALEDGYDFDVTANNGAHFFVNAEEGSVTTGFMAVDKTSSGKATDFTKMRINGLGNARVKIIGIK